MAVLVTLTKGEVVVPVADLIAMLPSFKPGDSDD